MKQVYFIASDIHRFLGEFETVKECRKFIKEEIDKTGFKSYYWNVYRIPEEDTIRIDYGSWSTFYEITNCTMDEYNKE